MLVTVSSNNHHHHHHHTLNVSIHSTISDCFFSSFSYLFFFSCGLHKYIERNICAQEKQRIILNGAKYNNNTCVQGSSVVRQFGSSGKRTNFIFNLSLIDQFFSNPVGKVTFPFRTNLILTYIWMKKIAQYQHLILAAAFHFYSPYCYYYYYIYYC